MLNKHDQPAESKTIVYRCRRRIIYILLHAQDGRGASIYKRNKYSSSSVFSEWKESFIMLNKHDRPAEPETIILFQM